MRVRRGIEDGRRAVFVCTRPDHAKAGNVVEPQSWQRGAVTARRDEGIT